VIRIEHLIKRFGAKSAVDDLSLSIAPGELFAFLGPNGAGKTTTIKILAGLLRPTAGTLTVAGHDVVKEPEAAKAVMAYVPDEPFLYDKLTGREFIRFVAGLYGVEGVEGERRIDALAEKFDFAGYMDELCEGYSHGMSQRIVIASALVHEPKVLLIDEPFVGLDPRSSRTLKDTFREMTADGATVFLSTHMLELAEELAQQIGVIHHGRLKAHGTREDIGAKGSDLEDIFLEMTADEPSTPRSA
jgi:ABC-2 type transport system ATP-binding protein